MSLAVVVAAPTSAALPYTIDSAGRRAAGQEVPERIDRILAGLLDGGGAVVPADPSCLARAERLIGEVHDRAYLDHLRAPVAPLDDRFAAPGLRQETPLTAEAGDGAREAARCAVQAAELAVRRGGHAYALVRPPGHHAGPGWYGGYCFLNNAVIAARTLLEEGVARVGVADLDYHLGNGTMACLREEPRLRYASIHSSSPADFPFRFPEGPGLTGLPADPDPPVYLTALEATLEELAVGAEALVVSVGYDILDRDPHGSWSLPPGIFAPIGALLAGRGLPLVFVQEGGYGLALLRPAARALAQEVCT